MQTRGCPIPSPALDGPGLRFWGEPTVLFVIVLVILLLILLSLIELIGMPPAQPQTAHQA